MGAAAIVTAVTTAVSMMQQQQQARAQQRAQQAAVNRQIQARQMEQQRREKAMLDQSKREQATARASFGARGVGSSSGSASALLQGIAADTQETIAGDRQALEFGIESLRENQRASARQNLLATRNSILNTVIGTGGKMFAGAISGGGGAGGGTGHGDQITW
ncbi:MAG: hypothetical protein KAH11_03480 [Rhodospirillales bacterium]|jgi:mannitol-specific phosphotransferase system IIBC component|nr:hypothetical protein [Rhodospirillales bacterium]